MPNPTQYHGVISTVPTARLADFYHELTGLAVTFSSEAGAAVGGQDGSALNFQRVADYQAPKWPGQDVPQQFHLDFTAPDLDEAETWLLGLARASPPSSPTASAGACSSTWRDTRSASASAETPSAAPRAGIPGPGRRARAPGRATRLCEVTTRRRGRGRYPRCRSRLQRGVRGSPAT